MDTEELPSLSDTLRYVACVDRVPGFGKNIDIYFEDNDKLPRALTCGLLLTCTLLCKCRKNEFCVLNGRA